MQQQSSGKPSPKAKPVTKDSTVVIYSGIVHEPPPPPPNQLMEMQSSITVIPPGGATPEETSFKGQTDGYNSYQPHINSATGEEKVIPLPPRSNTNNSRYPPAPTERAPSPPTGDSGLPPPIPARMRVNPPPPPPLDDSYYNRRLSDEVSYTYSYSYSTCTSHVTFVHIQVRSTCTCDQYIHVFTCTCIMDR